MATLRWCGCTTFVLEAAGRRLLLDAYVRRVPGASPTGLGLGDIGPLDGILLGHAHAHHMADAAAVSAGDVPVVCHATAANVLREAGLDGGLVHEAAGGERFRFGDVTVRVFPSLHACDWMPRGNAPDYVGLAEPERDELNAAPRRLASLIAEDSVPSREMAAHLASAPGSDWHGGVLMYLVEWPGGSLLYQDSIGAWSAVLSSLRPGVAILSAAGIPNLDGDPFVGSAVEFLRLEAAMLGWPAVVPAHHDNWMPPFTTESVAPLDSALGAAFEGHGSLVLPRYGEAIELPGAPASAMSAPVIRCPVCRREVALIFVSEDADGSHARVFCEECGPRDAEWHRRVAAGNARLMGRAGFEAWAAARLLRHASAAEESRG